MNARSRPARVAVRVGAALAALSFLAAACGDDDEDDEAATTDAPPASDAPATDAPAPTTVAFSGTIAAEDAELCALGQATFDQEDFPTVEQLAQYQELAPAEIASQVDLAAGVLTAAGGDTVALLAAFADDEVEAASADIDAWEESHCGIPHSESDSAGPGATRELDESATAVPVIGTEFAFEVGEVKAGHTTFVLTNPGAQAHYLGLAKLADGVTLDQALASEDGTGIESQWSTDLAAPGGGDEEYLTLDLAPGNYGLVCFLPDTDGTPHAFKGMAVPFTVA